MDAVAKKIVALRELLAEYSQAYYQADQPKVTDAEYDALLRQLAELETAYPQYAAADSPTKRVGGSADSRFGQVQHKTPLLSLGNAFHDEELRDFNRRVEAVAGADCSYVLEPKIDVILFHKWAGFIKSSRGNNSSQIFIQIELNQFNTQFLIIAWRFDSHS